MVVLVADKMVTTGLRMRVQRPKSEQEVRASKHDWQFVHFCGEIEGPTWYYPGPMPVCSTNYPINPSPTPGTAAFVHPHQQRAQSPRNLRHKSGCLRPLTPSSTYANIAEVRMEDDRVRWVDSEE
jgi:hypothetical protein